MHNPVYDPLACAAEVRVPYGTGHRTVMGLDASGELCDSYVQLTSYAVVKKIRNTS